MPGKLNAIASMYNGLRDADPSYTKAMSDSANPESLSADALLELYKAAKQKEEQEEGVMNPDEASEPMEMQQAEDALGLEKHMKSGMPLRKK
jgi:hypothetical protein